MYLGACNSGKSFDPTLTPMATTTTTRTSSPLPSATSTPSPTETETPTPTITPLPAWVTEFGQPILTAIAGLEPVCQDDFSPATLKWLTCWGEVDGSECTFSDGVLRLSAPIDKGAQMRIPCYPPFKTFALRADMNTSQLGGDNSGIISYSSRGVEFSVEMKTDGRWWLQGQNGATMDSGQLLFPDPNMITVTILARDSKVALYLNDSAVTIQQVEPVYNNQGFNWRVWSAGEVPAIVEFDNLKIWDLDHVPNIP